MALIRCPECSREISAQAETCPGCGYPLSRERSDREARLEEARRRDRAFLKKAGVLSLLAIAVILAILALIARGIL